MEGGKPLGTRMSTSISLDRDEQGKPTDVKYYRGMIGSLLYLTASRPSIIFSVCICAPFQVAPKESHQMAIKRILRYLTDTIDLGLWYLKDTAFEMISYSDADYAGCKIDRKSTSGTCHFLRRSLSSFTGLDQRLGRLEHYMEDSSSSRGKTPMETSSRDYDDDDDDDEEGTDTDGGNDA
ncbi:secreted RxLR effector protein 161-like [Malania oleifera]|uniref:secreted RxLR effector protein 161-like n=1 Tax=Malania oleifera TaxID=397392 RepID=UPI0025AE2F8C|nr:secreted RxLR effector protein 161-like [Malania oleifera]